MFGDVHVTKNVLRWRTALILRELEDEVRAIAAFRATEARLARADGAEGAAGGGALPGAARAAAAARPVRPAPDGAGGRSCTARLAELRTRAGGARRGAGPLARAAAELGNPRWGLLMRAGNDKSHLARQIERYADIYTSRVSNFLFATPFVYLRSPRGSLPHDPSLPGGTPVFPSPDEAGGGMSGWTEGSNHPPGLGGTGLPAAASVLPIGVAV